MSNTRTVLSRTFINFFESEKSGGVLLILCTLVSLGIANSSLGPAYQQIWHAKLAGLSVEHWVNDGLMAVFFLFIGLELERELYVGELSNFKNALLPIFAAIGGIALPALIHFSLNAGAPTQAGTGIPMATDIAFALGAIIVIAVFYTAQPSLAYLLGAFAVFALLVGLNSTFRVMSVLPYLLGGALMWFLMLKSGVHATIAGVMLAFAIPFSSKAEDEVSPSHRVEHWLHKPVAFIILPVFALANTAVDIGSGWQDDLLTANSLGIIGGLLVGKPIGITLFCFIAVTVGICRLPQDLGWRHVFGAGLLGGIGFTMSIFITNLAFAGNSDFINASKIAVLLASICAGGLGFLWLRIGQPNADT
jgi:NhaA family Na+:H+ antiporter